MKTRLGSTDAAEARRNLPGGDNTDASETVTGTRERAPIDGVVVRIFLINLCNRNAERVISSWPLLRIRELRRNILRGGIRR